MFYLDSNNNKYYIGRAFNYSDIQYSAAAATQAKFTELGFTQVTVDNAPDPTYYSFTGPDLTGSYSSTPKDLNTLKAYFIYNEKVRARQLLVSTDWLLIRKEETSDAVPAAVTTYRAAVRTANSTRCNEINAAADVAALETLIKATPTIDDPNNPGTAIVNPAAMTAYPESYDEEASIVSDYGL